MKKQMPKVSEHSLRELAERELAREPGNVIEESREKATHRSCDAEDIRDILATLQQNRDA